MLNTQIPYNKQFSEGYNKTIVDLDSGNICRHTLPSTFGLGNICVLKSNK